MYMYNVNMRNLPTKRTEHKSLGVNITLENERKLLSLIL